MSKLNPTLEDLLSEFGEKIARNVSVAVPGRITSYDASTETCSVVPAVSRLLPDETGDAWLVEDFAEIRKVPVLWPRGRNFRLKGTLSAGDPVQLLVNDRDLSNWRRTGEDAEPDDARVHDIDSAVAIPGLVPDADPARPLALASHEPGDSAALASKVMEELEQIKAELADLHMAFATHGHQVSGSNTTVLQVVEPAPSSEDIDGFLALFGLSLSELEPVASATLLLED